MIVTLSLSLC